MGRIDFLLNNVNPIPSHDYVKLAHSVKKYSMLCSLEKTAETREQTVDRRRKILDGFYKLAFSYSDLVSGNTDQEKIANCFIKAASNYLKANHLGVNPDDYTQDLEKIATIGVINYRLQTKLNDPSLDLSSKEELIKVGHENNDQCIAMLEKLANNALISGMKKAFGTPNESAQGAGSAIGSFFSKVKDAFSGPSLGERMGSGLAKVRSQPQGAGSVSK